jgi:hypothetical protein
MRSKAIGMGLGAVFFLFNLAAAQAGEGGGTSVGGGGNATEIRVNEIRADILKWIDEGGAQGLTLPSHLTHSQYVSGMRKVLEPLAVVVVAVTPEQEAAATDDELKVVVEGRSKTCRGFVSRKDRLPHILCSTKRFAETTESDQYRLIHHEYAGLAGIERNVGAASDYEISSQLTDFLVPETVLKLAVKKRGSGLCVPGTQYTTGVGAVLRCIRVGKFGPAWKTPDGMLWSSTFGIDSPDSTAMKHLLKNAELSPDQGGLIVDSEATRACKRMGGRLPTFEDYVRLKTYFQKPDDGTAPNFGMEPSSLHDLWRAFPDLLYGDGECAGFWTATQWLGSITTYSAAYYFETKDGSLTYGNRNASGCVRCVSP